MEGEGGFCAEKARSVLAASIYLLAQCILGNVLLDKVPRALCPRANCSKFHPVRFTSLFQVYLRLPGIVWLPASSVVSRSHTPSTEDRSGPRTPINVINAFASLSSTAIMETRIQMCGGCISIHTHSVPEAAQGCQPA